MSLAAKATGWAELALSVLGTSFPYGAAHQSRAPGDVDVTPARLHPAFHGCLDWHSSAHMQWSLVRLLTLAPDELAATGLADRARTLLAERLSEENVAVEAAYLLDRPGFERPYGWAWAAMLGSACLTSGDPMAPRWASATQPLADAVATCVLDWLPRQAYPVRHGVHSNSAFALGLLIDAFEDLGRADVVDACRGRAIEWFGSDRDLQTTFEPSGSDFLSPALAEADLMRRVLPPAPFADWLAAFLPGLGTPRHAQLLHPPVVLDRADGQFVHLFGLALSRGRHLRELAAVLPDPDLRHILTGAADRQVEFAEAEVSTGHFMSTALAGQLRPPGRDGVLLILAAGPGPAARGRRRRTTAACRRPTWDTDAVHTAFVLVVLVAGVTAVAGVAARYRISPPLLLVVAGFVLSYLPLLQHFTISSELVLVGLLPPLLYSAAIRTSLVDFRQNLRPILLLSVGLVVFTVVGVGFVAMWVLPIPAPIAFALGAIVAPPDAVAASAVARRVGMPRRLVTILEGESLVNDATALVALRTAVAAVAVAVSTWHVALDFVWASVGGALVGVGIAWVTGQLRKRVDDVLIDTSISLITPFVAYLVAEELHASGVLAVVVAGLLLGHKAFLIQSAPGRIVEQNNWRTIAFVLENSVFAMIGLQARAIVSAVGDTDLPLSTIIWACVAVLVTVIVLRMVWLFPATYVTRLVPRIAERDPAPNWRVPVVLGWAGMRGVVTLAAAFSLGADVKYREVLVLIALVVVAGTLLIQGSTLPALVRRLGLVGPDAASDALAEASVYQAAVGAGLARLDEITGGDGEAVGGGGGDKNG